MTDRLRILYNNVVDDCASISAFTEASASLAVENLLTEYKSEVWRANGKASESVTLTWDTVQTFNMAAFIWNNFSSAATMQFEVFTETTDIVPAANFTLIPCCSYNPLGTWSWGMTPLGVNAFSYGGNKYARIFFETVQGRKARVTVRDPLNTSSYVEAGRLVLGTYWSPELNPSWGAGVDWDFGTKHRRTDAGDLRTELRPQHRTLKLQFDWIKTEEDRLRFWEILSGNGMARPVYINLFPEDEYPAKEQSHQVYGKLSNNSGMSHPQYGVFSMPLVIEES